MNALLVVAKRPAPGFTKTRLIPPLTAEDAAQLYEAFLRDTLDLIRQVPNVRPIVAYMPEDADGYFRALAPDFDLLPQQGDDLGARLDNALSHCLDDGFQRAVIMDSDSPTLPAEYLARAFDALDSADGVIGPCDDGGYYLIGLNRPASRLLREVPMSTATVTRDTLALAAAENLSIAQLPTWYDVDTVAELDRLRAQLSLHQNGRAIHTRKFLTLPSPFGRG
ncbi:MAG: TIGR04282 family arsenosugar biosynthesis glycosyltransferase, partial [Chloroflexi bacterium]|nr:TIGR04282 family arsenosugar biosynthesis glycosyltransferase [Chloroflexota bacterium]